MTRFRIALIAVALAAAAAESSVPSASAGARVVPSCDAMVGLTVAQTDRWRVLLDGKGSLGPSGSDVKASLVACHRRPGPATSVIRIGRLTIESTSAVGVSAKSLAGDQLLVSSGDSNQYVTSLQYRLIDLGRARVALVGNSGQAGPAIGDAGPFPGALLLPNRAVVRWNSYEQGVGDFVLNDGRPPSAEVPPGTVGIVPALGTDPPGIYAATANGHVTRITSAGAAKIEDWVSDRALRPQPNGARVARHPSVVRRTLWARPNTSVDLVRTRHALTLVNRDYTLATLVRGSAAPTVVAAEPGSALVDGTFADQPATRTLRLLRADGQSVTSVDIPRTAFSGGPGSTALTSDGVALASPDAIRIFGATPQTIPAVGAHDLTYSPTAGGSGRGSLYFTDGAGTPHVVDMVRPQT